MVLSCWFRFGMLKCLLFFIEEKSDYFPYYIFFSSPKLCFLTYFNFPKFVGSNFGILNDVITGELSLLSCSFIFRKSPICFSSLLSTKLFDESFSIYIWSLKLYRAYSMSRSVLMPVAKLFISCYSVSLYYPDYRRCIAPMMSVSINLNSCS